MKWVLLEAASLVKEKAALADRVKLLEGERAEVLLLIKSSLHRLDFDLLPSMAKHPAATVLRAAITKLEGTQGK